MVSLCRVCLSSDDISLYSINNFHLINVYEKLTDSKYDKVGYPVSMCCICLAVLRKCLRFMETAQDTNYVLKQWYNQHIDVKVIKARPIYTLNVTSTTTVDSLPSVEYINKVSSAAVEKEGRCETDTKIDVEDNNMTHSYTDTEPMSNEEEWYDDAPQFSEDMDCDLQETSSKSKKVKATKTTSTPRIQQPKKRRRKEENSTENCHNTDKKKRKIHEKKSTKKSQNTEKESTESKAIENTHFECDKCLKTYQNKRNLQRHIKIKHTVEPPLACNICEYKTTSKYALKEHSKRHSDEKPFSCGYCEFKTARKSALKTHLRTHTEDMKFTCEICNKKFFQIGVLHNHIKRHADVKPFVCNVCGFMTMYKTGLDKHLSSVHYKEKPFSCDICSQKFAYKKSLVRHVMVHSGEKPYACEQCSYKCVDKHRLKMHMQTHSDEKPFECHLCGYKCRKKSTLATHIRTHTGERPFACRFCDYKSSQKSALNTHLKQHNIVQQ